MEDNYPLQILGDSLLSREPHLIREAFMGLDPVSKNNLLKHLERIVCEVDWHPEQKESARAARDTLRTD